MVVCPRFSAVDWLQVFSCGAPVDLRLRSLHATTSYRYVGTSTRVTLLTAESVSLSDELCTAVRTLEGSNAAVVGTVVSILRMRPDLRVGAAVGCARYHGESTPFGGGRLVIEIHTSTAVISCDMIMNRGLLLTNLLL